MNSVQKAAFAASIFAATLTGGALGATVLSGAANAQTGTTTAPAAAPDTSTAPATPADPSTTAADPTAPPTGNHAGPRDPSKGGHTANGITETVLTGDDAAKATASAKAAVPDGTIERVETDAEGDAFEAHVVKADGSHVTVKMAADFSVTKVETGR